MEMTDRHDTFYGEPIYLKAVVDVVDSDEVVGAVDLVDVVAYLLLGGIEPSSFSTVSYKNLSHKTIHIFMKLHTAHSIFFLDKFIKFRKFYKIIFLLDGP